MGESKLSETVLLPETPFAMRGQLPKQEPGRLESWLTGNLYGKIREERRGEPHFFLHDGPPYANGHIHIGHALNKILKDIIVRYKTLRGFDAPYLPGWDCHGLPIELKAIETVKQADGADRKMKIRKACREYAGKFLDIQRGEFQRLGILGEFEKPYITMDPEYQASILEGLAQLVEKGYVARAEKPVLWCSKCRTALADAEVEYEESSTPAITVKFPLTGDGQDGKTFLLIWTTTPWTLPANIAVAVNPEAAYIRAKVGDETWILAEARAESVGIPKDAAVEKISGKSLVGLTYRHPFADRSGKVYPADFVTLDTGTGLVHIAPGHGEEDFQLGQKFNLQVLSPVDFNGRMTAEAGEFSGQFVFDANPLIIEKLKSLNLLVRNEQMTHTYPHCWRCKRPVIFRATPQWFIRVDHLGLRQKLLDEIGKVRWFPAAGERRIRGMIESRPDWCISRQRAWGVPIPAVHCVSCGHAHLGADIVRRAAERVKKDSADVWFAEPPETFLPAGWSCPKCGGKSFKREEDILDVWFDSGMSHVAAHESRYRTWPADLYLEGSDQHRGWFQVSLILGVALRGAAPFRQVLTHGFVMDGEGRKMSKSLGNVVTPQEVVEKFGADVLRLWVASSDYSGDIRVGQTILNETIDTYRRIRNTIRYLLGNLNKFDPSTALDSEQLDELDAFILERMHDLKEACLADYDDYQFSSVARRLRDFCSEDLSGFYLDVLKDRLYCDSADSQIRRSAQAALWVIAEDLIRLAAPILPYTAEEAWESWGRKGHVTYAKFAPASCRKNPDRQARYSQVLTTRKDVNLVMEQARQAGKIGSSLDAAVTIRTDGAEWESLNALSDRLAGLLIASRCVIEKTPGKREIMVEKSPGEKCDRCWKYVPVRKPTPLGTVCDRCSCVIE